MSYFDQPSRLAAVFLLLLPLVALGQTPADSNGKTEEPSYVLVEGQIFNHSGGGIEGATVTLTSKKDQSVLAETTTTEYGDFQIKGAKRIASEAVITFTKTFYVAKSIDITLAVKGDPPFVDHEMQGAIVLQGLVQDKSSQKPVPKVKIVAKSGYKDYETETGADGTFKIEGLLPGGVSIKATADGYADFDDRIRETQNAGIRTILLSPERIVHLIVVGDDALPIAGAVIEVVDLPHRKYRQTTTDALGKATLKGLDFDSESLKVRLTHETRVSDVEFERAIDLPKDKTESQHTLVMASAGIVVGKITSKAGDRRPPKSEPANGARISVGSTHQDGGPKAWSDFDGLYEIRGIAPGQAVVTVHLAGHAPELRTVMVTANKKTTVDFQLRAGRSITGIVKDPDGKGHADTYVTTTKWRDNASLGLAAMTDANGAFEIFDAPLDSFMVAVYADGFKALLDQEIAPDQSAYEFKLELDPRAGSPGMAAAIKTGEPAPDFSVTTLEGKTLKLTELSGKVVLLDFWATWCGPCLGEIPGMINIQKTYGARDDFVMISVSLDSDERQLRTFVKERKMNWHHVWGDAGGANTTADAYGVVAIPSMMVIDRKGKLVASDGTTSSVMPIIQKLLDSGG